MPTDHAVPNASRRYGFYSARVSDIKDPDGQGRVRVRLHSAVAVSAGMVTVDAGMSKFSGVVQADTVIANNVIGASYTPGAGNIW